MNHGKLIAGATTLALIGGGAGMAAAASGPSSVTVSQKTGAKFKANRYIQDELRWNKDVYTVKSAAVTSPSR